MVAKRQDQLLAQGDLVAAALKKHESSIGVKQNTFSALRADLQSYRSLDSLFQKQREARKKKLTPEQQAIDVEALDLIKQTKNIVSREFGATFNESWEIVGYTTNLRMPRYLDEREALVGRIAAFLEDNPRFENEGLGVTAVRALTLHERFIAARSAAKDGKKELITLSSDRDAARAQVKTSPLPTGPARVGAFPLSDDTARPA